MEESIMVMEKARPHLKNLSKVASELNTATDLYTAELKAIEEELNKLNLGLAIELDGAILEDNSRTIYDYDSDPRAVHSAWTLGYGKDSQGHWCFLIREYEVEESSNHWTQESVTSLLSVSRDLRIAAAEKVPELLEAIEKEAKSKIEILAKASDKR